jgi:hypothetical protein
MFSSKTDQNQSKKLLKTPSNPIKTQIQNSLIDSTKTEVENQFTTIEEIPSNEHIINVPQGSIASDIQQIEDLNDNDGNSDIEQQPISNLNLDEVSSIIAFYKVIFDFFFFFRNLSMILIFLRMLIDIDISIYFINNFFK